MAVLNTHARRCHVKSRKWFGIIATISLTALALGRPATAQQHHHYKLVDIGTLGGPQSFVNGGGGLTQILNNQGTFTGCADTLIPDPSFADSNPQIAPPDPFFYHAIPWRNGVLTDLGALPGVNSSCSFWISGNGLIAGLSENGVIDPFIGLPAAPCRSIIDLGTNLAVNQVCKRATRSNDRFQL